MAKILCKNVLKKFLTKLSCSQKTEYIICNLVIFYVCVEYKLI